MKQTKKLKIAQSFQRWLLALVLVALLVTTAFFWIFQTHLAKDNTVELLRLNLSDVRQDIVDASNANLLELSRRIAEDLNGAEEITSELLEKLTQVYDVTEINYIDPDGIIRITTFPDFQDYDMRIGEQSAEFMVLLSGETEYVQSYRPVSYDASISRKYAGVALEDGGFVQVGYGAQRFRRDIDQFVVGVTRNRHVGEGGGIIIADENGNIVSDRMGYEGQNLNAAGVLLGTNAPSSKDFFISQVYGVSCYCLYQVAEGYTIVAFMPLSEAAFSRNVAVSVTTVMQIMVFAALFILTYFLVNRLVVKNIYRIKHSLSAITDGDLDTVVDVRSHMEFDALSNDINSMVDTLKRYISDAEARIDAELAYARAIQHSALPSVFPPYPNRNEFSIFATMQAAKEVGGDFYDFYFVDEDTLAFLVADVSGKGIPAAMFMMTAKTLLKSYAEAGMSVEEVLTNVNEKLCQGNEAGMFVTAWMGFLNIKTGKLTYANAGHNPPLIQKGNGSFEYLRLRSGLVLAGMEGVRYRKHELQLSAGDAIYLYTDGVTEATDPNNDLYGEERLRHVLNSNGTMGAEEICRAVHADVDRFAGQAPQFDDVTMLSVIYHGK